MGTELWQATSDKRQKIPKFQYVVNSKTNNSVRHTVFYTVSKVTNFLLSYRRRAVSMPKHRRDCSLHGMDSALRQNDGFTLIELSITLVIIGLLIGGVLVGRDLIKSSEIRSQISQINEFTVAVNSFKVKYGYLPGDMPPSEAAALGFFTFTGANAGKYVTANSWLVAFGNNDGAIGYSEGYPFWSHLSDAKMLKGGFGGIAGNLLYSDTTIATAGTPNVVISGNNVNTARVLPKAKIGGASAFVGVTGNHFFAASEPNLYYSNTQKVNIFKVNAPTVTGGFPLLFSAFELYSLDSKIDDGMPATGNVRDPETADMGSGTFPTDNGYFDDGYFVPGPPCTTDSEGTKINLAQEYDLNPATANDKNCTVADFLF